MSRPDREASRRSLTSASIETASGSFTAHFSECGLAELDFPKARSTPTSSIESLPPAIAEWRSLTSNAVNAILSGRPPEAIPPLDIRIGSDFQRRVWNALREIPMGQTKTYGEIASHVGEPEATQAVGAACGANPIPLLIPCHRVVAS